MRGGASSTATKRSKTLISQSPFLQGGDTDQIHHRSSKFRNTNIHDLPDSVLVEILCRSLLGKKSVFQWKCVSKRWHSIISDPYSIGRFLHLLQSDDKQTLIKRTMINYRGEEFLTKSSSSPSDLELLLTRLFKRLMSFHRLEVEPVVVGTYNDLILCCASECFQRDYYICNLYTMQWVALPPTPTYHQMVAVGFICHPYYPRTEDNGVHRRDQTCCNITSTITKFNINAEYRCKVVRIPKFDCQPDSSEFEVEIFSSETGEWRESIVSSPLCFDVDNIYPNSSFAYNGMLYWREYVGNFLVGLDPFKINSFSSTRSNSNDVIDRYECRIIGLYMRHLTFQCVSVYGGCLRMCYSNFDGDIISALDLALKEEQGEMVAYISSNLLPFRWATKDVLAFDPNDEDVLYLNIINEGIVKYNIRTSQWSKVSEMEARCSGYLLPLVVQPWWPTTVPRLPQLASTP